MIIGCTLSVLITGGVYGKTNIYGSFGKVMHVLGGEVGSLEMETDLLLALRPAYFFFLLHLIWCFNEGLNPKPVLCGTLMALIGSFLPCENLPNPLSMLNFILAINAKLWREGLSLSFQICYLIFSVYHLKLV